MREIRRFCALFKKGIAGFEKGWLKNSSMTVTFMMNVKNNH